MSLEDSWDSTGGTDDGPLWGAQWSGDEGTITTGALPDDFDPHDFDQVLARLGYTPGEIRMELASASRWEQRSAVRDDDGRKTGEMTSVYLNAYKYKAVRNALCVNLPALYAEVRATRPGKPKPKPTGRTGSGTIVICYSDIQMGKTDHIGGLKEILERLDDKREALENHLDNSEFSHIVFADAGDAIEGFDNVSSQARTNCLSLMDQVDVAATEMWKFIRLCSSYAPVDVLSIPSNHCRWARGKDLIGKTTDDWGLHINKRLERQNDPDQGGPGLPVTFHRSKEWEETLQFDIGKTRLGLVHGHQASSPDKVKDWWAKMTHAGVLDCDILVSGHYHFPSLRPSGKNPRTGRSKWHIQASTLDNGSSWVRNKFGEDGEPALTVFRIDEDGFDVRGFSLL